VEKSPKTVMVPLYITHADTVETRDLCAYLQKALRIDIDPDVGPNTPGVSELRFDARRLEPAEQYPSTIDPLLDSLVLVDTAQPHFEAADYFWPTKPGRYTLWHASAPCAVFVLTAAGDWVNTDPGPSACVPRMQATMQGAGWIGARVGAKPAEIVLRAPAAGASVGKTQLSPWPATYAAHPGATYAAHPGTAPSIALVAGENVTLRTSERLGEPFVTIETLSPPADSDAASSVSAAARTAFADLARGRLLREAAELIGKYGAEYPHLHLACRIDQHGAEFGLACGSILSRINIATAANHCLPHEALIPHVDAPLQRLLDDAVKTFAGYDEQRRVDRKSTDVAAAKRLIADAKAAFAAATKGSKHDKWAFDWGPRLWAVATQLLDERPPQIESQGEKHDDTCTTKSGGSEPGHAGPAAAGG
jgi:hypothetical protein